MIDILLYGPEDYRNVCNICRTLELMGINHCYIWDRCEQIKDEYPKSLARRINKISVGSFSRMDWRLVEDPEAFLKERKGRTLATVDDVKAVSLDRFSFQEGDLLVFGAESYGLPKEIQELCSDSVTIPSTGIARSHNVNVALAICTWEAKRQLEFAKTI